MTSSIGRRILAKLCRSKLSSLSSQIITRFSSVVTEENESVRNVIPALQPGKIQAALLKEFSSPLVIENIEPPKRVQTNEVSTKNLAKSLHSGIKLNIIFIFLSNIKVCIKLNINNNIIKNVLM